MADATDTKTTVPDSAVEGSESPDVVQTPQTKDDGSETFSAEYVNKLRTEAAEARVRAGRVDDYAAELFRVVVEREAAAYLRNGSDLHLEPTDYLNSDGYPDVERIREAAQALVEERPYLARVSGPVGQGPREPAEPAVTLGGLLRAAAQ